MRLKDLVGTLLLPAEAAGKEAPREAPSKENQAARQLEVPFEQLVDKLRELSF